MDPDLFAADLAAAPAVLRRLADALAQQDPWAGWPGQPGAPVLMLGMGCSAYAAGVAAARLRAGGSPAVAELASTDLLPRPAPGTTVVAVSASGTSAEVLDAVDRLGSLAPAAPVVALTAALGSPLAGRADVVVDLAAEPERGGVACRSYAHTLALLLALERRLLGTGAPGRTPRGLVGTLRAAAAAREHLLEHEARWRPRLAELLLGPDGTHVVAPARRLCSAQQSALMLREGPRRLAAASETGDWSHVDVYLTKTTDYRLLLLAGSRWEAELLSWTRRRGSTVVAVGAEVPGAAATVRYPGDGEDDVRLLTEVAVAELLAARAWQAGGGDAPAAEGALDP